MIRIHQLIENKEYPNSHNLAREFEMSDRTIKRNIDFMKTRLKLPMEFDVKKNGFYFTRSVPQFPQMPRLQGSGPLDVIRRKPDVWEAESGYIQDAHPFRLRWNGGS